MSGYGNSREARTQSKDDQIDKLKKRVAELEKERGLLARQLRARINNQARFDKMTACQEMHLVFEAIAGMKETQDVYLQHGEYLEHRPTTPEPGAPGIKSMADQRSTRFRLYIRTNDGKFCDRTKPTLAEAVMEVFAELKLDIPETINT